MKSEEFYFKGKENLDIHVYKWISENIEPKAVVQIAHGMSETAIRYEEFAHKLTENGYIVYINDHRGHGLTAKTIDNVGYLAEKDGFTCLVEDMNTLTNIIKEENTNNYINKAIEFIQNNYHNPIKVTDIADYICLNRSYLTSIFQSNLNMSPQKFLMKFRITKAAELLYNTDLPISNIAYSCGYSDPLAFSKTFKKIKGVSPKEYRNTKKETTEKYLLSNEIN